MDYLTRVKKSKEEYKAVNSYPSVLPDAWMINFFIEWEKVTALVKRGAAKRGVDLNFIEIVSR